MELITDNMGEKIGITSDEYDAIIVSERRYIDRNRLKTDVPVIEAAGATPEQIYQKVRGRIQ